MAFLKSVQVWTANTLRLRYIEDIQRISILTNNTCGVTLLEGCFDCDVGGDCVFESAGR